VINSLSHNHAYLQRLYTNYLLAYLLTLLLDNSDNVCQLRVNNTILDVLSIQPQPETKLYAPDLRHESKRDLLKSLNKQLKDRYDKLYINGSLKMFLS